MKTHQTITLWVAVALASMVFPAFSQSINQWRGNETGADWNDTYKWKLKHVPTGIEAIHFRQQNSVISINSTIELGNGMHLYGQELLLEGNGNINLRSPIPHQRTITIPASSSGYANLTLADNLSVNAQVSLAAKAYGTSASKGSVTLKDRTTVTGKVVIGNDGNGSGKILLRDQSNYCITHLQLNTLASKGGSAEIHILGGTARFAIGDDPFATFLADSSRKIVMGNYGTLHIESDMPISIKRKMLQEMIKQKRIVSTQGCELGTPVFHDNMVVIKTESVNTPTQPAAIVASTAETLAAKMPTPPPPRIAKNQPQHRPPPPRSPANTSATEPQAKAQTTPLSGFIVFFSGLVLLAMRPAKPKSLAAGKSTAQSVGKKERDTSPQSQPALAEVPEPQEEAA